MRLRRNRVKEYLHRKSVPKKDSEGGSYMEYGDPVKFQAEMWSGGGREQAEMYGTRLPNIRNLRVQGNYEEKKIDGRVCFQIEGGPAISVNDGICIFSSGNPDYKVVAVYPRSFLTLEVERL